AGWPASVAGAALGSAPPWAPGSRSSASASLPEPAAAAAIWTISAFVDPLGGAGGLIGAPSTRAVLISAVLSLPPALGAASVAFVGVATGWTGGDSAWAVTAAA